MASLPTQYQLLNTKQLLYRYRSVIPSKLGYKEEISSIRYRYLLMVKLRDKHHNLTTITLGW